MTEEEMREMFGDADPFSDFFHTFFGGAGPMGGEEARARPAWRTRRVRPDRAATSSTSSNWASRTRTTARCAASR